MVLEDRPSTVHVVSRLRFDAALYAPPTAAASWPERTPTPAWGALAGLVAADRPPAALDRPAPGALWPRRHTADLDPRCAVVRRAPLATGPDGGGARPQWTTSGRSLLLHRPGP